MFSAWINVFHLILGRSYFSVVWLGLFMLIISNQ